MILPGGEPLRWNTPGARWDGTVEEVMAALARQNNSNTTMSSQNLVSNALTAEAVTAIGDAVATIRTNLPFLLNLNHAQRKSFRNITEASQGIVQATINFVAQHPEALPGTFNVVEFNKDAALFAPLQQVASLIASLNTDTETPSAPCTATSMVKPSMFTPPPKSPTVTVPTTTTLIPSKPAFPPARAPKRLPPSPPPDASRP